MPEDNKTTPTLPTGKIPNNNVLLIGLFSFMITVIFFGTFIVVTLRQTNNPRPEPTVRNEEIGPLVTLGEEIVVNIKSEEGFEHYLKIKVTLETDGEKTQAEVNKRVPQIRDLIISIVSSKTKEKISEKEGKDLVRSEIINSINQSLSKGKVRRVFFEDFVIQ